MADYNFITLHIVNDIPWSNLNRDDTGTPKRTILGGVERGLLSSQSIKRAIRKDYENRILANTVEVEVPVSKKKISSEASVRTRYTPQWVLNRGTEIASKQGIIFDEKKATKKCKALLKKLAGGEDNTIWLSVEELETLAEVLVENNSESSEIVLDDFIKDSKTGSLAIAAFGRMFANAVNKNTEAAIAVSPAISTHANLIEADYFTTVDDFGFFQKDEKDPDKVEVNYKGSGSSFLDTALYTSGIFYRSITIDVRDLVRNWTGYDSEFAATSLKQLALSLIQSLPTGKKNHAGAYIEPPLIIVEEQNYREAYSIAKPLQATKEGGFLTPTIDYLLEQKEKVREFNPSNYGRSLISGAQMVGKEGFSPLDEIVDFIVEKISDVSKEN